MKKMEKPFPFLILLHRGLAMFKKFLPAFIMGIMLLSGCSGTSQSTLSPAGGTPAAGEGDKGIVLSGSIAALPLMESLGGEFTRGAGRKSGGGHGQKRGHRGGAGGKRGFRAFEGEVSDIPRAFRERPLPGGRGRFHQSVRGVQISRFPNSPPFSPGKQILGDFGGSGDIVRWCQKKTIRPASF
jgi:hypothetical protein